jgi:hypothetical protein
MTCWCREEGPQFPRETGCREAALILLKEKGLRYTPLREPLLLGRCVLCWEQEWDDCFEVTEFNTKESFIFKVRRALPVWTMRLPSKPPPPPFLLGNCTDENTFFVPFSIVCSQ